MCTGLALGLDGAVLMGVNPIICLKYFGEMTVVIEARVLGKSE